MTSTLLFLAGCCSMPPLDDMRSKQLSTPYDAIDYLRYAVRLDDWDAIYGALSPESRRWIDEKVGRFAFRTWAGSLEYRELDKDARPEVAHLKIAELIHRSKVLTVRAGDDGRTYRVQLSYAPEIKPGRTNFPLIDDAPAGGKPRWTIGIIEWMREQQE